MISASFSGSKVESVLVEQEIKKGMMQLNRQLFSF